MTYRSFVVLLLTAVFVVSAATVASGQATGTAAFKNPANLKETAPAKFKAKFETSAGVFVVEVDRSWAPLGADRFYNLVKSGYYDDIRFFRVMRDPRPFMVQFGIHGDPSVNTVWRNARLGVDPVKQSNRRGYITYAMGGSPDTRTTQVFINFGDNSFLDATGFAPFGRVTSGMDVVDKLYSGYGDSISQCCQGRIQAEGNAFLNKEYPRLDYIKKATIEP